MTSREQDYCRGDDHGKSSSRERRKELKEIRKRKYGSQHKRKMLKMDGEGVSKHCYFITSDDILHDLHSNMCYLCFSVKVISLLVLKGCK